MTALRYAAMTGLAVLAAGCAPNDGPAGGGRYAAGHFRAEALLRTAAGGDAGSAVAAEHNGGIHVTIKVKGVPPGIHGVHVHAVGKCEAPDFASAGGHWNPVSKQHGTLNPAGPHAGDLPNLEVDASGNGTLTMMLPGGTYEGLLDEDGSALVMHAGPDDLKTDPSGNSGGRIACGVFGAL
jgi:Cu-Zn family superoxide dismutase